MNNITLLDISLDSILPIFPLILLILLMVTIRRRRREERERDLVRGYGRKGGKDNLWLIIKDYLKKKSMYGYSIYRAHAFDRPARDDMHTFLKRGMIFAAKREARERGRKYVKPEIPKRFGLQDYFENLEAETEEMNREFLVQSKRRPRRRYVILYKTKCGENEISDWSAIEAEILKKPTRKGGERDVVVVNRELDVALEMSWIAPLLDAREEESNRKPSGPQKNKKKR